MERCETGKARIKGMLPQGTDVAHKTGTLGGVADDVGVITLPGEAGPRGDLGFHQGFDQAGRGVREGCRRSCPHHLRLLRVWFRQ